MRAAAVPLALGGSQDEARVHVLGQLVADHLVGGHPDGLPQLALRVQRSKIRDVWHQVLLESDAARLLQVP
eukprot:6816272-Heterocapsa_arctica.AAC.1